MPRMGALLGVLWVLGSPPSVTGQEPSAPKPTAHEADEERVAPLTVQQLRAYAQQSRALARASRVPFANPPEIHSGKGVLQTTLVVNYANNRIGNDRVSLRSYNGFLVGPTLRIQQNDRLSIRLVNDLPDEAMPPAGHDINDPPHGSNTTNLHTHGLHVSPEDNSDNVLLEVPPRGRQDFVFLLGAANSPGSSVRPHPPGTHWYHPHKHGSVAIQVASGMAGALIVEGGLDEVDQIKAARERIFVFQQIPYSDPGADVGTVEGKRAITRIATFPSGSGGQYTTVNGLLKPVIEMAPKEVERWRFIHAGLSVKLDLALKSGDETRSLEFHEIAADGIALGRIDSKPQIDLSPGYRSDVLIKAPDDPGEYFLLKLPETAETALRDGKPEPEDYIARIVVRGPANPMEMPDRKMLEGLAPYPTITAFQRSRKLEFGGGPDIWKINDEPFKPDRTDQCPVVGTAEEWTITSVKDDHPFHIHVNPFEVLSIKDKDGHEQLSHPPVWKDTILLKADHTIRFRTRFEHFPGKTVLHCHKLDHEDKGMMQLIRIQACCPKEQAPAAGDGPKAAEDPPAQAAASWRLPDAKGTMHELREFAGRPLILVFFRGMGCPHCVEQLRGLADRREALEEAGVAVVAIDSNPQTPAGGTAGDDPNWPFPILADVDHEVFKRYGCYEGRPMHGVFAIDGRGRVRWRTISETPFADINRIVEICEGLPAE